MLTTLYKKDWRTHGKLVLVFLAVILMYLAVIIRMYDPADGDVLRQLTAMKLSPELLSAFGFSSIDNSLAGFLASYLYGFLLLALPLALIVMLANRLVSALVDKGSMASILSSAVTRRQVAFTQAVFLVTLVVLMTAFTTGAGLLLGEISFPGLLDPARFLRLNFGLLMALLAISAVSFFFSCLFSESRLSLAFGAGIPVLFLVAQMLYNYDKNLGFLRYFSLFSLFVPEDFVGGAPVILPVVILGLITLALYGAGILVFDRKDLPL